MAITRTAMVDDDGSGTLGTVFNNAWKTELYNQIDANPPMQSYVPVWKTAGGDPYLGAGSLVGAYATLGKLVFCTLKLTLGAGFYPGAVNDAWLFSMPVPPLNTAALIVVTGSAPGVVLSSLIFNNQFNPIIPTSFSALTVVDADTPKVWAVNDTLTLGAVYWSA